MKRLVLPILLVLCLVVPQVALAQEYSIEWWTVDAGGGAAGAEPFTLHATAGQPDAGTSRAGQYELILTGFWNGDISPTAIELVSFTATPMKDGSAVLLTWETVTEIDTLGFHLCRAESPEGPKTRLTEKLVPGGPPGSPVGFVYTWLDATVAPETTYFYWLDDVDNHGRATRHGPISTTTLPRRYFFYLPLIRKP